MPKTEITGRQIKDSTITAEDIDITDATYAIPTRIIAGDNVTISETGARTGSGDVTINAAADAPPAAIDGGDASTTF